MRYYFRTFNGNGLETRYPRMSTLDAIQTIAFSEKEERIILGDLRKIWENLNNNYKSNLDLESTEEIEFTEFKSNGIIYTNKGKITVVNIGKYLYGKEGDEVPSLEVTIEELRRAMKHKNYIYANNCDYGTLVEGEIYDTDDDHISHTLTEEDCVEIQKQHVIWNDRPAQIKEVDDKISIRGSNFKITELLGNDFQYLFNGLPGKGMIIFYDEKAYEIEECEAYYLFDKDRSVEIVLEAKKVGLEKDYEDYKIGLNKQVVDPSKKKSFSQILKKIFKWL
jgi:hypothetical protein